MISIEPGTVSIAELHGHLLAGVAPRPIALASTIDEFGNPNLSPFSFFNVFSANPPIAIFSPARRVRNNTTKDTLTNAQKTREVVINIVNYDIVEQVSLSSTEYPTGVNEFVKSGLTPIESLVVKPFRVKESPMQLECIVRDVVELGQEGGAGNLIICEVKMVHINPDVFGEDGKVDQHKMDLVGRLGKNWYVRASGDALFEVEKPHIKMGIGYDAIPPYIRNSFILSGNDLGKLGNIEKLPEEQEIEEMMKDSAVKQIFTHHADGIERREALHEHAKSLLENNQVWDAWRVLLTDKLNRI